MVWSGSIFTLLNPPQFRSGYLGLVDPNQPDWVGLTQWVKLYKIILCFCVSFRKLL